MAANVTRHGTAGGPGQERTSTSTSSVITVETLEDRCKRLQEEWTAAEHQKMASEYQSYAGVDRVTEAVQVEGQDSYNNHCLYLVRPGQWRALPFEHKPDDASETDGTQCWSGSLRRQCQCRRDRKSAFDWHPLHP